MKLHATATDQSIDLGDITVDTNQLYIATKKGWSCWMGAFIEPHILLGYPVDHWPHIAKLKLPDGSVDTIRSRHLLPKTGMGTSLALWLARFKLWKDMGVTPDTTPEMLHSLFAFDTAKPGQVMSWHQLHQIILLCTVADEQYIPYTAREKELLTWL